MNDQEPQVWWSSRIIWAQLIAALFAVLGLVKMLAGYDLIAKFGLDPEQLLTAIMLIIPAVTIFIRVTHPTPPLVGSTDAKEAAVANIARAQARRDASIAARSPEVPPPSSKAPSKSSRPRR